MLLNDLDQSVKMQLQEDILKRFKESVAVHPIERKPKPNLFNP